MQLTYENVLTLRSPGDPTNLFDTQAESIEGSASTLPKLIGDERRFQQVMINLVKNAIKFTQKGKISIKASYDTKNGLLVIHVRDTGTGIAAEDIPTLFKRFGKLQRTATLNNDGIGLGLMIVK